MLETRFLDLALAIEKEIRTGVYQSRLPAIRTLATIYSAAPATMQKAVTELIKKGLVIPQGAKGNLIVDRQVRRPHTQMVGVFCNRKNPDISKDIMLQAIQEEAARSNWICTFMNIPGVVAAEERLWVHNSFEGYIFLYSSISESIANLLKRNNIPFLAANRVPDAWGCSWVDFDLISRVRDILGNLARDGKRRIGINLPLMSPDFYDFFERELMLTASEKNVELRLFNAPYGGIEHANRNCHEHMARYRQGDFKPDGIILIFLPPDVMRQELSALSPAWQDTKIIALGDPEQFSSGGEEFHPLSYRKLGQTAWSQLLRKIEAPDEEVQRTLI